MLQYLEEVIGKRPPVHYTNLCASGCEHVLLLPLTLTIQLLKLFNYLIHIQFTI